MNKKIALFMGVACILGTIDPAMGSRPWNPPLSQEEMSSQYFKNISQLVTDCKKLGQECVQIAVLTADEGEQKEIENLLPILFNSSNPDPTQALYRSARTPNFRQTLTALTRVLRDNNTTRLDPSWFSRNEPTVPSAQTTPPLPPLTHSEPSQDNQDFQCPVVSFVDELTNQDPLSLVVFAISKGKEFERGIKDPDQVMKLARFLDKNPEKLQKLNDFSQIPIVKGIVAAFTNKPESKEEFLDWLLNHEGEATEIRDILVRNQLLSSSFIGKFLNSILEIMFG